MRIQHDNLTIRSATVGDCEQLAMWWNDGKVMSHAGFPNGLGITADEIAKSISSDSDNQRMRMIIEIDNVSVGEMNYRIKDEISPDQKIRTAEIDIKICDFSMQEKGYGKKLLSMLIRYLFEDMQIDLITLDTNLNNKRAQHVYEQLGFKMTRIDRDSWTDQLGNLQSAVLYELKREDFVDFLR